MTHTPRLLAAVVCASLAVPTLTFAAQPAQRGDPPPLREGETLDAQTLRERLERMRDFAARILEQNEQALERLDAGEDPQDVVRALRVPGGRAMAGHSPGMNEPIRAGFQRARNRLSEDDLGRVRAFISEHFPRMDEQLESIEQIGPLAADRFVERLAPRILEIIETREHDPALATLQLDELRAGLAFVEATREYRRLRREQPEDQDGLAEAADRVRDAARQRFETQVALKNHEIERLSARVLELKDALTELRGDAEAYISAQVEAATGSRDRP